MPKYITSSTLWYSGIFAAAATFDAGIKKQRREQWDLAIAGVKQELEQPTEAAKEQLLDVRDQPQPTQQLPVRYEPFDELLGGEDIFRHVDPSRPKPLWPTNTGPALIPHNLPPQSIYADDGRKFGAQNAQLTAKKLARLETSVEILQLKLLLELQQRGWSEEAAKSIPDDYGVVNIRQDSEELNRQLEIKRETWSRLGKADSALANYQRPEGDTSLCSFAQANMEHANLGVRRLNWSLRNFFKLEAEQKITKPSLIAQTLYNLCVSSSPPNLNTFNTLLLGFSRAQEPLLVDHVIREFRQANFRPNEISLVAILNHYTNTDQPRNFAYWIGLMRGKDNGLMLARPDINITDAGRSRLVRKADEPWKVVQLPYPTPSVFGAVIAGVIKFAGFDKALSVCQDMGREGWGLCMAGLTPLLQDCAERGNWGSGTAVWDQIQALKTMSRRKVGSRWMTERIQLGTFAAMLRLCTRSKNKESFDSVWTQAMRTHPNSTDRLTQLVKGRSKLISDREIERDDGESVEVNHVSRVERPDESNLANSDLYNDPVPLREVAEMSGRDHRSQYQAASKVPNELQAATKEDERRRTQREHLRKPARTPPKFILETSEILEQQLYGNLPACHELDEYELRERPMTVNG